VLPESLKPAIRAALRHHEIGPHSPYRIAFAGKGQSGGSFGAMQGDLAAGPPVVRATFEAALAIAGLAPAEIAHIVARLSVPVRRNPLDDADTALVNIALAEGHGLVDLMDETLLETVLADLEGCLAVAAAGGRRIAPEGLLFMALWINMTGKPTTLLRWLGGADIGRGIPVAPDPVDAGAMEAYLRRQKFYAENPQNWAHMVRSVAAGLALVEEPGGPIAGFS
jgi:hypothetical protein